MACGLHSFGNIAAQRYGGQKIGVEQRGDLLVGEFAKAPAVARADIVDEDVDLSVTTIDILDRRAAGRRVGDIESSIFGKWPERLAGRGQFRAHRVR